MRLGIVLASLGIGACRPADAPAVVDETRTLLPQLDLEGFDPTIGGGGASDTDVEGPTGRLPDLTWNEMFARSGLCTPPACTTRWQDLAEGSGIDRVTYVHTVAGGWHVAGPDDPWFTVLADVQRDTDGDGTLDTRGLVLAWDPVSRSLIDQPLLPDDFVTLGLIQARELDRTLLGLSIVDADDDGTSELVGTAWRSEPLLRFDPTLGRLVAVGRFVGAGLSDALAGAGINLGLIDVDNDGLLDLEWPAMTSSPDGPVATFVQAGLGTWEHLELFPNADAWMQGSGLATLWDRPGGLQLRLMPGNDLGECFVQQNVRGVPELDAEHYPRFSACDIGVSGGDPAMGAATVDLNGDGVQEIVSTLNRGGNLHIREVRDFWSAQIFDASAQYAAELPVGLDRPLPIVPWAVEGVDLDRDGWRDLVVANGEDMTFNAPCEEQPNCVRVQPVGIWINPGVPVGVDRATTHTDLQNLPLDHVSGNVAPIGDFNGGLYVNVDGDGDQDYLFSPVYGGEPRMFVDDTEGDGHGFCLRGRGTTSNHLGIGSFVEVETGDGHVQSFQLGGSAGPNVHTGDPEICVGTGAFATATVRWTWPSGTHQTVVGVPAKQGSEPAAYVIEEPATFTVTSASGQLSTRRVAVGATVTLQVCAFDDAPVPFGRTPARSATTPDLTLVAEDLRGAATTLTPASLSTPSGCKQWSLTGTAAGQTRLTFTVDGVEAAVHPRVWWED